MNHLMTIQVLGFGELYQHLLNAVAAFMKQDGFWSLLKLTSLMGIILASVGYLKERNPFCYARWIMSYVLVCHLAILPKTSVMIYDISAQKAAVVEHVPVVFAATASLITTVGVGLAESYDVLLTMPDDLTYTKTGALFGAKMIQAARSFRIINPILKEEMNAYFRNCVVGDIQLNHKYSASDLSTSLHVWNLISKKPSKIRMTLVDGTPITCSDASLRLKPKLDAEIKKAYTFFGINLFGRMHENAYEKLFETRLTSAFNYYQNMTDSAANIFLQSMMINAIGDGINDYQAFTDSTAGVLNNQVSKSQVQHRWAWQIAGQKATWFLPLLHALLTLLLFGIFPIILVMTTLPNGVGIFKGYLQFFVSLQFWPVLFAVLNAVMTLYGKSQSETYGALTLVNIDKLDELHGDLSGVAGYLMLMIPFIAKGLVSNLSEAFSGLATSMTGHLQGSAMTVANDAASANFSLGQTSFYNTSANNFSANKHDNNWTHMHGMHTEQLGSGVLKTKTSRGDSIIDAGPGISKAGISINVNEALSGSFNQAYEASQQAAMNESAHFQTSLSNFAHRALQLSQIQGHDMRLGDGVSSSESGQYSKALSTMNHIASDVAKRVGVSQDDAMQVLTSAGIGVRAGISSNKSVLGSIAGKVLGFNAGGEMHAKTDRTSTSGARAHTGMDGALSAREAHDFHEALNHVRQFASSHHFDDSHSKAAHLSNQLGADLREAETASHNFDASKTHAERIQNAKTYAESKSAQIHSDLNQAFHGFVSSRLGGEVSDKLFSNPGDMASIRQLEVLGNDFISHKRDALIAEYGNKHEARTIDSFYHKGSQDVIKRSTDMGATFKNNSDALEHEAAGMDIDTNRAEKLKTSATQQINEYEEKARSGGALIKEAQSEAQVEIDVSIKGGTYEATEGIIPGHTVDKTLESLHIRKKP